MKRPPLTVNEASTGWSSDDGFAWMARNCEVCQKGSARCGQVTCPLEMALWVGAVPTTLSGFGVSFSVFESAVVSFEKGKTRTQFLGRWDTVAEVPDHCPQRVDV